MARLLPLGVLLAVATGCQQLVASSEAAEPAPVWMSRDFSWGVQCREKAGKQAEPGLAPGPRGSPDAGAAGLQQQLTDCFRDDVSREAGAACAVKAIAGAGVAVRERRLESMSVCEACGCPANALRLSVSVATSATKALEAAGFKVRKRPPPAQDD